MRKLFFVDKLHYFYDTSVVSLTCAPHLYSTIDIAYAAKPCGVRFVL